MKKSTLQVRLNRRVTFDRRIEVPSPSFFFLKIKNEEKKSFADWLIELLTVASACARMPSLNQ